jgi:transposase
MRVGKLNQRLNYLKSKKILIGVDIGSRFHYFQAQHNNQLYKPIYIKNDIEGFNTLKNFIEEELKLQSEDALIGFEPTGPYWEPLANFLNKNNYSWVFVNPGNTKRYKEVTDNSPNKNDSKDASVILALLKNGHYLSNPERKGDYRELFNWVKIREQIIKQKVVCYNQIISILAVYFPELLNIFCNIRIKALYLLLKQFLTPEDISQSSIQVIYNTIEYGRSKKWAREKANQIMKAAKSSVGVTEGLYSYKWQLKNHISQIENCNIKIDEIDKNIKIIIERLPEATVLKSIKGIGDYTVAVILSYFGPIGSYSNAYELLKFAGLNLYEKSSGLQKGYKKISKRGPSHLRKVLFLLALRLISYDDDIKKKYQHYVEVKHHKMKSIVAIMCYLVKLIFALSRDNVEFNRSILKQNIAA